jgi:undecaprenyl-diphosphatase
VGSTTSSAVERAADAGSRFGRRSALLGVALVLVAVPFGLLVHQVVVDGPLAQLDERSARWLHVRVADLDAVVAVMKGLSFVGSSAVIVPAVGGSIVWLVRHQHRRLALFLAVASAGGVAVSTLTKIAVGRPRPELREPLDTAFGKSFPSGHSMGSLVCFGALLVVFLPFVAPARRRVALVGTVAVVLAVGVSRLVLGVHFVSDVLGGYVLGIAWLAGMVALFETWRAERGQRPADVLSEGIEPEAGAAR